MHFNNVIYGRTEASSWVFIVKLSVLPNGHTGARAYSNPRSTTDQSHYQHQSWPRFATDSPLRKQTTHAKGRDVHGPLLGGLAKVWLSTHVRYAPSIRRNPHLQLEKTAVATVPTLTNPALIRYHKLSPTVTNSGKYLQVWTLDVLDQTAPPINVGGVLYTLQITGFSVPNMPTVQKTYFISQGTHTVFYFFSFSSSTPAEGNYTLASIYARLITACPSISDCPSGQSLVIDSTGTQCVCSCPADLPACPKGTHSDCCFC